MNQKFPQLSFVHVTRNAPGMNFPDGFDGIVKGTYSQLYSGTDINNYSVYVLGGDEVVNCYSWFHEDQLTLLENQDSILAQELIEKYNFK